MPDPLDASSLLQTIVDELKHSVAQIDATALEQLADAITAGTKVFVAGAGRSGFMAKCFAMRLMHMGIDAYVIGETITPGFTKDDILLIASGSGETQSLVVLAEKARKVGGSIAVVTLTPDSTLGQLAQHRVQLQGAAKDNAGNTHSSIQPMASLFEQTLLLVFDTLVLKLMEKKSLDGNAMFSRHANLE